MTQDEYLAMDRESQLRFAMNELALVASVQSASEEIDEVFDEETVFARNLFEGVARVQGMMKDGKQFHFAEEIEQVLLSLENLNRAQEKMTADVHATFQRNLISHGGLRRKTAKVQRKKSAATYARKNEKSQY